MTSQPIPLNISGANTPAVPFPHATTAFIFFVILFTSFGKSLNNLIDLDSTYENYPLRQLSKEIDLILSDVRMPGASGIDLLKQVRDTDPKMPVFCLISGQIDTTNEMSEETLIEAGAKKFFAKPVDLDVLLEDIIDWFKIES